MKISDNIKKFRKEKGLTQQELADNIDRSLRMVQKYESGEVEPSIEVLDSMVKVLGDDFAYSLNLNNGRVLFGENDTKILVALKLDKDLINVLIANMMSKGEISQSWLHDDDSEFIAKLVKDIIIQQTRFLTQRNFDIAFGNFSLDLKNEDDEDDNEVI